ncbi:MAG: GAF domain-containing protein [Anaerolineae bacterium]|nr:GAF domain-containing protein [Anaerolineae bacterium]
MPDVNQATMPGDLLQVGGKMTTQFRPTDTIRQEAQVLGRNLHNLQGVLLSQREILRQRGMTLPSAVFTLLEDAQIAMQDLINGLKEEEEALRQLRALTQTAALINSTLDLDEVLSQAMDTVLRLTGAERGYLMLRNEQTQEMEYRVARNLDRETIAQDAFTVSRSVIKRVADTGEPVVTTNAQDDPRFAAQESIVSFALRSILCVPLKSKGHVIGVIYADNRIRAGLFGDSELAMLNAFANQAAIAIENARLFERIRAALAEISEIKALLDDVFASIPSGVIVTDAGDQITLLNDAACDILHLTPAQVIGGALPARLPMVADSLSRALEATRLENRRMSVELQAEVEARGTRILSVRLSPLRDARQSIEGVAIVMDDLTEARQREAQLNVIRRYLPPAMVDNIQSIAQLGLGGVRRDITVLYVDIRLASTLLADLSPQQQLAELNRYVALCCEPIHRFGGVIDKFMGTEIMALFNTQLNPSATHAWDAVRAALDIAAAFAGLHTASAPSAQPCYAIGIHSGIATMGNVGSKVRREFTAIGDTVNLAHRLLDLADDNEILASQEVYKACAAHLPQIAEHVQTTDRGEIEIRGRQQPARIYQFGWEG